MSRTAQARIFCCAGTPCLATDSEAVKKAFAQLVGQAPGVEVRESGCIGQCSRAPMVRVELPDG
jgi:NADH:ubiquinone oxidoreductase subunit E